METSVKAVDRLPLEIVEKIMLRVMSSYYIPMASGVAEDRPSASWFAHVQLTLVCRSWRRAALSCFEYWADLPFFRLATCSRFQDMLARSRQAPLQLVVDKDCYMGPPPHRPGPTHLHITDSHIGQLFDPNRLLDVHLYADESTHQDLLAHFPDAETPKLRSIIIHPSAVERQTLTTLPSHILTRPKPALQELILYRCRLGSWTHSFGKHFSPNLRYLQLKSIRPYPPLDVLASVLDSAPKLEQLWLTPPRTPGSTVLTASSKVESMLTLRGKLKLPLLNFLCLDGNASFSHALYRLLDLPQIPAVDIRNYYDWNTNGLELANAAFKTFGIGGSSPHKLCSSLELKLGFDFVKVSLTGCPSSRVGFDAPELGPLGWTGKHFFKIYMANVDGGQFCDEDLRTLQVNGLTTLQLEGCQGTCFSPGLLDAVFRHHPDVTSLCVITHDSSRPMGPILAMLNGNILEAEGKRAYLLPNLRVLRLVGAAEESESDEELVFNILTSLLQSRIGDNALTTLEVSDLEWTERAKYVALRDIAHLQGTSFSWDGSDLDRSTPTEGEDSE